ncbi:hypothetical protein GCM10023336_34820 [Streptomyces similanensis]|uniref:Uncharacterized protein n=1 Tax=Streptomyces similanensis TaxID=1274988 RepID=A0ABP9KM26_9ACTN
MGPLPEAGGGLLLLVGEDLAAGEAGAVVDGGVEAAVAQVGAAVDGARPGSVAVRGAVAASLGPAVGPVPAAVGDVAQLLDVDVDEFAGPVAFVAAHDTARGAVQMGQAGQTVARQHAVHGGGHQVQEVRDAGRPPPAQQPDLDDPSLGAGRSAPGAVAGPAGAVAHTGLAESPIAVGPPLGCGRRDLEALGGPP